MKMLKDKIIHQKVLLNQIVGLLIGYLVTKYVTLNLVGYFTPDQIAIGVTILFFILSYIRMYSIDWFFKYVLKKV